MTVLAPGDTFPPITASFVGGATLDLPPADHYTVVLLFRGAWCPYCNAQLRAFERAHERPEPSASRRRAVRRRRGHDARVDRQARPPLPVGHSADAHAVRQRLGAFVNADPEYVHSTGFVVDPSRRVIVSVYSSGAMGRLLPDDVIGLVRYLRAQDRDAA